MDWDKNLTIRIPGQKLKFEGLSLKINKTGDIDV
jgi:hypothetical protein